MQSHVQDVSEFEAKPESTTDVHLSIVSFGLIADLPKITDVK